MSKIAGCIEWTKLSCDTLLPLYYHSNTTIENDFYYENDFYFLQEEARNTFHLLLLLQHQQSFYSLSILLRIVCIIMNLCCDIIAMINLLRVFYLLGLNKFWELISCYLLKSHFWLWCGSTVHEEIFCIWWWSRETKRLGEIKAEFSRNDWGKCG